MIFETARVGFTGTRLGMSKCQLRQLEAFILQNRHLIREFHHGDCVGADEEAHYLIQSIKYTDKISIVIHPPLQKVDRAFCNGSVVWPEKDYTKRNRDIVDCCSMLIAAPYDDNNEELRSGTWSTVRYAQKMKKGIYLLRRRK